MWTSLRVQNLWDHGHRKATFLWVRLPGITAGFSLWISKSLSHFWQGKGNKSLWNTTACLKTKTHSPGPGKRLVYYLNLGENIALVFLFQLRWKKPCLTGETLVKVTFQSHRSTETQRSTPTISEHFPIPYAWTPHQQNFNRVGAIYSENRCWVQPVSEDEFLWSNNDWYQDCKEKRALSEVLQIAIWVKPRVFCHVHCTIIRDLI